MFDKQAFVEMRRNSRSNRDHGRRHSSLEPISDVLHIESEAGDYALVNKLHGNKKNKKNVNKDVSHLLSPAVRAQLPLDATEQIGSWEEKDQVRKSNKSNSAYAELEFHTENSVQKGKIVSENVPAKSPMDPGKTKFGYSTVVFENEKKTCDKELAEQMKQNKAPPVPPPKYEASSGQALPKHASDSRLLYSDVDFTKTNPIGNVKGRTSSPDLRQSDEHPYVNVRRGGAPVVPPRRGVASPIMEQSPPVPVRKTS